MCENSICTAVGSKGRPARETRCFYISWRLFSVGGSGSLVRSSSDVQGLVQVVEIMPQSQGEVILSVDGNTRSLQRSSTFNLASCEVLLLIGLRP